MTRLLNEVPEHMAQECGLTPRVASLETQSSMKFLSTWLRNSCSFLHWWGNEFLNEVPEHMAQESHFLLSRLQPLKLLNEVPEHMAQESVGVRHADSHVPSSMKFLSTWLRNRRSTRMVSSPAILNEVPEHMAQEYEQHETTIRTRLSSMKFLSTWLRNDS